MKFENSKKTGFAYLRFDIFVREITALEFGKLHTFIFLRIVLESKPIRMKHLYNPMRSLFILALLFVAINTAQAEGTPEIAPNDAISIGGNTTPDRAALFINNAEYANFAYITNSDSSDRLYFRVESVTDEIVYLGFSQPTTSFTLSDTRLTDAVRFRIVSPSGVPVTGFGDWGQTSFDPADGDGYQLLNSINANISTRDQVKAGPQQIVGAGGYNAFELDLQALGLTETGDYYIEFAFINGDGTLSATEDFLIEFWDITVADKNSGSPIGVDGRVWAFNWALFAVNDFGFPNRPFNGAFFVMAPASVGNTFFITKIDFNGSDFRPAGFNVAFNDSGPNATNNLEEDRKSLLDPANTQTNPKFQIFLNNPDEAVWPSGVFGELGNNFSVTRCGFGDFCINVSANQPGQFDILLDFTQDVDGGTTNRYDPNTRDVIISFLSQESDFNPATNLYEACVPWDGRDGQGVDASGVSVLLDVVATFAQGPFHFPIWDAEFNTSGFSIESVRPLLPGGEILVPPLFWDDSNLNSESGTSSPKQDLNGCTGSCHTWTNYTDPETVGYGNKNTINTWWFANRTDTVLLDLDVPDYIVVSAGSDTVVCNLDVSALALSGAISFSGGAEVPEGAIWTTDGDGTFDNPTKLDAVYTFGLNDINTRLIELTLAPNLEDCNFTSSTVMVEIDCPFPVEWLSLDARLEGNDGIISWSTETELNNDFFEIERSDDAREFTALGKVKGAGTTNQATTYEFTDLGVNLRDVGEVYYRIKQVDLDGSSSYSNIMSLQLNPDSEEGAWVSQLYPNPTDGELTVKYMVASQARGIGLRIGDMLGRVIYHEPASKREIRNTLSLNVESWAPGIYFLELYGDTQTKTYKFIVK